MDDDPTDVARAIIERMYLQGSLFGTETPTPDEQFEALHRYQLDERSWVDHAPGWLRGADDVFTRLVDVLPWRQHTVMMYGRRLPEPRLSWWWKAGVSPEPLPVLADMRNVLGRRYGVDFDSIGFNYYRDGSDSVAWHGDTKGPQVAETHIAIVSVGAARPFRMRARTGSAARHFDLGYGDLLVMGGACQHQWEHGVPKVRASGPRISITYRHSGVH